MDQPRASRGANISVPCSWSEWQDLNLRPPRPERGTPPYSVQQQRLRPLFEPPRQASHELPYTDFWEAGDCLSHLGQRQLTPELLQMRGHDRPSEGLRPLWRVKPDLERDSDSRQHATQHKYLDHRHFPWPFGLDDDRVPGEIGRAQ